MTTHSEHGAKLRAQREARQLTPRDAARAAGVSTWDLKAAERGKLGGYAPSSRDAIYTRLDEYYGAEPTAPPLDADQTGADDTPCNSTPPSGDAFCSKCGRPAAEHAQAGNAAPSTTPSVPLGRSPWVWAGCALVVVAALLGVTVIVTRDDAADVPAAVRDCLDAFNSQVDDIGPSDDFWRDINRLSEVNGRVYVTSTDACAVVVESTRDGEQNYVLFGADDASSSFEQHGFGESEVMDVAVAALDEQGAEWVPVRGTQSGFVLDLDTP